MKRNILAYLSGAFLLLSAPIATIATAAACSRVFLNDHGTSFVVGRTMDLYMDECGAGAEPTRFEAWRFPGGQRSEPA